MKKRKRIPVRAPASAGCNGCGGCCDPVVLAYSKSMARLALELGKIEPANARWVEEDLTPVHRAEGMAKADYLGDCRSVWTDGRGELVFMDSFYYSCRHYGAET